MVRTAIVKMGNGTYFKRMDGYRSQREMAEDLRGNGYRVAKIFNGDKTDEELEEWLFWNRKI